MVSTSGRPEGDTALVSGFGCSGVFGGCLWVRGLCSGLGMVRQVVVPSLCWVLGLGPFGVSVRRLRFPGVV